MDNPKIVSIKNICSIYEIPISFIDELVEYEFVEINEKNKKRYIKTKDLNKFEKIIRLHFDLNINMEGIDVINNLLNKIDKLEKENLKLKNMLSFFD